MERSIGLSLDLLSTPGDTLQEILDNRRMTQKELAIRTNLTTKHINKIIKGEAPITYDTAIKLEKVFGISADFWINLESKYCAEKARICEIENITDEEVELLEQIPVKDLIERKLISASKDKHFLVEALRAFYAISDLRNIGKLDFRNMAFRKGKTNHNIYALYALIRICELVTFEQSVMEFDKQKLKSKLTEIKKCMLIDDINKAIFQLKKVFAECGVAFEVVKEIKNAPLQGLIKKTDDKILLCLTIRYKYADIFWFSLFHEIGHLLYDNLNTLFVDLNRNHEDIDEKEKRVDKFASDTLIYPSAYNAFLAKQNFNIRAILEFAKDEGVIPGIVVGRLQHDKKIGLNQLNSLRTKYEWA